MTLHFLAPALLAGLMVLNTSCKKDDDNPITPSEDPYKEFRNLDVKAGQEKEIKFLDASSNSNWVYFSFEKGVTEVTAATPTTSWDIAFKRYDVRTNSGDSGNGNGGALKTEFKNLTQVATVSTTATYTADKLSKGFSYGGNRTGGLVETSISPVFAIGHGENFWNMISGTITATIPGFSQMPAAQQEKMIAGLKAGIVHNNGWLTMDYTPGTQAPTYTYNQWVYVVKAPGNKYAKIQLSDYKDARNKTGYLTFKYQIANTQNEFK